MNLTPQQKAAVLHAEHSLVVACPGSGKTRAIIAKLLRCVEEVRDSARRIACITFTNTAVYEIEDRLRSYGGVGDADYCEVSTIHAFCLNNILRHFYWRVPELAKGFVVLPPDDERYIKLASEVCARHGVKYQKDTFELIGRRPDGTAIVPAGSGLTEEIAVEFWGLLHADGNVDFSNIVYYSYHILSEWKPAAQAVAARFAWVLVDEFQDTSALQVEILKLIADAGSTRFFLVGDPYQSIFGFAGAHPDGMWEFSLAIGARDDFQLSSNFRSSSPIIEHAERLWPREPPMDAAGEARHSTLEPWHVHADSAFEAITGAFLPVLAKLKIPYGQAAILAPSWFKLIPLSRRLRAYGVPVLGPGARPYKRVHLFATLAEQICGYLMKPNPRQLARIERELFFLVQECTGKSDFSIYSYSGRVVLFRLLRAGALARRQYEGAQEWLVAAAESIAAILSGAGWLTETEAAMVVQSAHGMVADIADHAERGLDVSRFSVADLGLFSDPDASLKLLSMHKAKGREFEAVALIGLHEGQLPHGQAKTAAQLDEAKRLFYVAVTRAKRVLLYVTDNERRNAPVSRFLGPAGLDLFQSEE